MRACHPAASRAALETIARLPLAIRTGRPTAGVSVWILLPWFWRAVAGHSDEVTLDWRHEDDGPAVRLSFPTADYLAAVRTLDRELIATMRQRVEELERRGGLPGIDIDLPGLRREHDIRARGLSRSLDRTPNTDWGAV